MRPSSLRGGRILRRTLYVCLSVRPVIERHVAPPSELQWHTEGRISYGHLGRTNLFYTVFIVLSVAVRALVSLALLLGFTCLVVFVYFVYFYEQINEWMIDWLKLLDGLIYPVNSDGGEALLLAVVGWWRSCAVVKRHRQTMSIWYDWLIDLVINYCVTNIHAKQFQDTQHNEQLNTYMKERK